MRGIAGTRGRREQEKEAGKEILVKGGEGCRSGGEEGGQREKRRWREGGVTMLP